MSITNFGKACTFSEMNLHITYKGEDVKNAKVTRSIEWDKEIIDTFQTDEFGKVRIPSAFQRSARQLSPIPIQFTSFQSLDIAHNQKNYTIWVYSKMNPKELSEFNGKALNFTCELTDEEEQSRLLGSLLSTKCKWNEKPTGLGFYDNDNAQ